MISDIELMETWSENWRSWDLIYKGVLAKGELNVDNKEFFFFELFSPHPSTLILYELN